MKVYYARDSLDAFTAAWAILQKYEGTVDVNFDFMALQAGSIPPLEPTNELLYLVGLHPSREAVTSWASPCPRLMVIECDSSALLALRGLPSVLGNPQRSLCQTVWSWLKGDPLAPIVRFVDDAETKRFRYPNTQAILASLATYPRTFEQWDDLNDRLAKTATAATIQSEGEGILRYQALQARVQGGAS